MEQQKGKDVFALYKKYKWKLIERKEEVNVNTLF
jgi:hypothetical protein